MGYAYDLIDFVAIFTSAGASVPLSAVRPLTNKIRVSPVESGQGCRAGGKRRREVHSTVVGLKRKLPAEGTRDHDCDRAIAIVSPGFNTEERAGFESQRVEMLQKTSQ